MYDIFNEIDEVGKVHVANPCKVRAIAEAKIKTDAIDARTLAHLLKSNLIPIVYVPSNETRRTKDILRQRMFLVRIATRIKSRIHDLVERYRIKLPKLSDPFGKTGISFLKNINLTYPANLVLRQDLFFLKALNTLIKEAKKMRG